MTVTAERVFCDLSGCHESFKHGVPNDDDNRTDYTVREYFEIHPQQGGTKFQIETRRSAVNRAYETGQDYNPLDFCCQQHSVMHTKHGRFIDWPLDHYPIARMK